MPARTATPRRLSPPRSSRPRARAGTPASASGWCVYVLRCGDGSLYTGCTNDLAARLARHAAGKGARYTRSRLPLGLVHEEPCADRGAALRREAAIKRLTRKQKVELVGKAPRRRKPKA